MNYTPPNKEVALGLEIVRRANKHARGAIAELSEQLETARREEKKRRLLSKIKEWQVVLDQTNQVLDEVKKAG